MASWWLRLIKHRRLDEADVKRWLLPDALQRVAARVAASERHHSGEIRICIEAGLPLSYLRRGATVRERAVMMFAKLRVWDTEHNNGVLIYLLLAERAIEIVADRGLASQVDAAEWQRLAQAMSALFKTWQFEAGLDRAIEAVDAMLRQHFPLAPGQANPNELPDEPYLS